MNATQTLNLAVKHHQAGNLAAAEPLYRQILDVEPGNVDARHLLGVIAHQCGRHELAVEYIRSALRDRPSFSEALCNLGAALQALGQLDEAVACYRQALRLKPDYAEAHNNLGNALRLQDKADEAVVALQQALRLRPGYVGALTNMGLALQKLGRLDEAVSHHQLALRLQPNNAETINNLGVALQEQGRLDEAAAGYRQALRLKPTHADAHNNLGNILHDQGRLDEARSCYDEALRLQPDFPAARCNVGLLLQQMNDLAGSEQAFRAVLRDHPDNVDCLWQLAIQVRGKLPAVDRAVLEQRLTEPGVNESDRAKLRFGLAQVCDARGEFEQAAAHLRQANALIQSVRQRKGEVYNLDDAGRFLDSLLAAFTPAFFEKVRGFGLESDRPVFIVGLPRSGTTLTEQILAAHSQVFGAGELPYGRESFQALSTPGTAPPIYTIKTDLGRDDVRLAAQRHFDHLSNVNRTATRVVDKMPENYFFLGALAVLFPRAKFIHCRRDLRDVALSCWMTHFRHLRWANDVEHIVARFRDYLRLMEHWRAVLPVSVLEVDYEETVADLPGVARKLVEWCGLDWEPGCVTFHEGMRPVRTASVIQVRQPVYTRSVARWRHYERELGGLFAALEPLIAGQAAEGGDGAGKGAAKEHGMDVRSFV